MIKQWDTHNLPSWLTRCLCWLVLVLVDTRISWYSYISWLVVWLGAIVTLGCGGYVIHSLTHSLTHSLGELPHDTARTFVFPSLLL